MAETLIMIMIADRPCALPASDVETVVEITDITPVPRAPKQVIGLAAMRSQALIVVDCRTIVGEDAEQYPHDDRMVVIRVDGYSYALRVDEICDVGEMIDGPIQISGGFGPTWSQLSEGMVETEIGPTLLLRKSNLISFLEEPQVAA